MRPLRIGFTRTWRDVLLGQGTPRSSWVGVALLVIALAALAYGAAESRRLADDADRLRASLAVFHEARARSQPPARVAPAIAPEVLRQAESLISRLNVPWTDLFDLLERHARPDVALLRLEPDSRSGSIAVTVEARSMQDLLAHVQALEGDAMVLGVHLTSHDTQAQEAGQPIRLTMTVLYRAARP